MDIENLKSLVAVLQQMWAPSRLTKWRSMFNGSFIFHKSLIIEEIYLTSSDYFQSCHNGKFLLNLGRYVVIQCV